MSKERHKGKQQFLAMYCSIFGGITTDPAAMVIPMDDHMVHRGHGIFDTAAIVDGYHFEMLHKIEIIEIFLYILQIMVWHNLDSAPGFDYFLYAVIYTSWINTLIVV